MKDTTPVTSGQSTSCPNCGATTVDDDGDCTSCREPGVPSSPRDFTRLANEEHALCESSARDAVQHAVAAGQYLLKVKAIIHHGQWDAWLKFQFAASHRTANAYMRLAREYPKLSPQIGSTAANLTIRKALASVAYVNR